MACKSLSRIMTPFSLLQFVPHSACKYILLGPDMESWTRIKKEVDIGARWSDVCLHSPLLCWEFGFSIFWPVSLTTICRADVGLESLGSESSDMSGAHTVSFMISKLDQVHVTLYTSPRDMIGGDTEETHLTMLSSLMTVKQNCTINY